ncbi:hypothetical protein [Nocardia sp. NPDC050710]|uniref:hypothetical protein n=1 Tax=Nocardia sp. NPDC050710 TaxID=3157220 RepID=UPI0033C59CC1
MKAAILGALTVPLLLIAPGTAPADPGDPPQIFNQEEKCAATKGFVDQVRGQNPEATPEQIADVYIRVLDSRGAYRGIEHIRESDRQQMLENIQTCGL